MTPRRQPPVAKSPSALLTPRAAAAILSVHPDTLAKWCDAAKEGPLARAAVRFPGRCGHRRYREDAIREYARSLESAA